MQKIEEQSSSQETDQCACDNLPQKQGTSPLSDIGKNGLGSPASGAKQDRDQNATVSSEPATVLTTNDHVELGTNQQDTGYCSMDVTETVPCSENSGTSPEIELCSPVSVSTLCNIGERLDVTEYADSEWRGHTPRALLMREVIVLFFYVIFV